MAQREIALLKNIDSKYIIEAEPNYLFCNLAGCQAAIDMAWDMHCYAELCAQLYCCLSPGEARRMTINEDCASLRYQTVRRPSTERELEVPPNVRACLRCQSRKLNSALTRRQDSVIFREIWSQTGVVYHLSGSGSATETALYLGKRWQAPMILAYPRVELEIAQKFYRLVPTQLSETVNSSLLSLPRWFPVQVPGATREL